MGECHKTHSCFLLTWSIQCIQTAFLLPVSCCSTDHKLVAIMCKELSVPTKVLYYYRWVFQKGSAFTHWFLVNNCEYKHIFCIVTKHNLTADCAALLFWVNWNTTGTQCAMMKVVHLYVAIWKMATLTGNHVMRHFMSHLKGFILSNWLVGSQRYMNSVEFKGSHLC